MTPQTLQEQLTKYLTDAHSIEQQALAQMRAAPKLTDEPQLTEAFSRHLDETAEHERLVRERLAAHGARPAPVKDIVGTLTGKGFVLFARSQPDTTGKLVAHGFSYEHMELAAYELLARVAERAGDDETVGVARRIGHQEREMGQRLSGLFDRAAGESLDGLGGQELEGQLDKYLADAHAIEAQALALLERAPALAGSARLARAYEDHLVETHEHERALVVQLRARGASPSRIKDAALRLGALNWGAFFRMQPDTPAKLAAFSFAFEHLEVAAYELLKSVARQAGDPDVEALAERILGQERAAAERIGSLFDEALEVTLREQGVTV